MDPLLFNIFLRNLFSITESKYLTNYTDDATPYVIGNDTKEEVSELKTIADEFFIWYNQNKMKANLDKCHLVPSATKAFNFQISETVMYNLHSRKLLGVTFDNKLKFEKHIPTIFQKANRKFNALVRVTPYVDLLKRCILKNALSNFQFK